MKRFRFRLERMLDYRNSLKKEKERELGLKQRQLHEAEEGVKDILEEQEKAPLPGAGTATMAEHTLSGDYQNRLRDMLIHQRLLVLEAVNAVETARDAYIEKAVEAEALERYKGKRVEEYKDERRRQERKIIGDNNLARYRRGKGSTTGGNES